MAFKAADGKQFGNRQRQQKYDSVHAGSGATQKQSDANPADAVAQHGPANNIQITKGKGAHHVVANHPDGHTSKSSHSTAAEAMDAARTASGADEEAAESPEFEAGEQEGAAEPAPVMSGGKSKSMSSRIPGV